MCNTGKLSWRTTVLSAESQEYIQLTAAPDGYNTKHINNTRSILWAWKRLSPLALLPPQPRTREGVNTMSLLFPSCIRNFYRNTSVLLPSSQQARGKTSSLYEVNLFVVLWKLLRQSPSFWNIFSWPECKLASRSQLFFCEKSTILLSFNFTLYLVNYTFIPVPYF